MRKLYYLIEDNHDAFLEALVGDLGKPAQEAIVGELGLIVQDILSIIKNVGRLALQTWLMLGRCMGKGGICPCPHHIQVQQGSNAQGACGCGACHGTLELPCLVQSLSRGQRPRRRKHHRLEGWSVDI